MMKRILGSVSTWPLMRAARTVQRSIRWRGHGQTAAPKRLALLENDVSARTNKRALLGLLGLASIGATGSAFGQTPPVPIGPGGGGSGGGGGSVSSTDYATVAAAAAATIPNTAQYVRTAGYATAGDGGDALYKRVGSPAVGGFTSADGAFWAYVVEGPVRLEQFGGGVSASDNTTAFGVALQQVSVGSSFYIFGPQIQLLGGTYNFLTTIDLKKIITIEGASGPAMVSGSGTIMKFPANTMGIIVNRYNTLGETGQITPTTGADGSTFRNLMIRGGGGTDQTRHGIWMIARATLENIDVWSFPGNNVEINSTVGGANPTEGNCNGWFMKSVYVLGSGLHGYHVDGSDANAGVAIFCGVLSAGCAGVYDSSFLGNTWVGIEVDSNASLNLGRVSFGGNDYQLIKGTPGIGAATTPGTNSAVWALIAAGATQPAWDSGATYVVSCSVFADSVNSTGSFLGVYIEGGYGINHIVGSVLVTGGGFFTSSTPLIRSASGVGGFLACPTGVGSYTTLTGSSFGTFLYVSAGGGATNGDILRFQQQADGQDWRLSFLGPDIVITYQNSFRAVTITGPRTAFTAGRISAVPYMYIPATTVIGGTGANARIQNYGSAIPTTGPTARGEIMWNFSSSPGLPVGWTCITAGTNATIQWQITTAYIIGNIVFNLLNVYICTTGGTSAGSGGPVGTGTGITDGTVVWNYVSARAFWGPIYSANGFNQHTYSTNSSTSASLALVAADIFSGMVEQTLNLTGAITVASNAQLPTVALLVAAIANPVAGQTYKLRIINGGGTGSGVWTITTNTSWTLTGTMTLAASLGYRDFIVKLTSLTTASLQSLGGGTITAI